MHGRPERIDAAGGVLWRSTGAAGAVEIALVHRPGKNWSLPKGKLERGEHFLTAALREVHEETGFKAHLGPALGSTSYLKGNVPKRVKYWSMHAASGDFTPSDEIDDLAWLTPEEAATVARGRDLPILQRFKSTQAHLSQPLVLVTPASVKGKAWRGKEERRPLDHRGRQQAAQLAALLETYGIRRALASDARCCIETLHPLERTGISRETVPPVRGSGSKKRAALKDLVGFVQEDVPTALCAEQRILARLAEVLTDGDDKWRRRISGLPHASLCVLHLQKPVASGRKHVVMAERILARRGLSDA